MKCPTCGHAIGLVELATILVMPEGYAACPRCYLWLVMPIPGRGGDVRELSPDEIRACSEEQWSRLTIEVPARAMAARL